MVESFQKSQSGKVKVFVVCTLCSVALCNVLHYLLWKSTAAGGWVVGGGGGGGGIQIQYQINLKDQV